MERMGIRTMVNKNTRSNSAEINFSMVNIIIAKPFAPITPSPLVIGIERMVIMAIANNNTRFKSAKRKG